MTTITERVARGAEFLDIHDPDWWRKDVPHAIDLDTLELASPERCVLGQRCPLERDQLEGYGNARYFERLETLSQLDWSSSEASHWATDHGFNWAGAHEDSWDDLTAEWARVIRERRAA